jgi:hypothetical protein
MIANARFAHQLAALIRLSHFTQQKIPKIITLWDDTILILRLPVVCSLNDVANHVLEGNKIDRGASG